MKKISLYTLLILLTLTSCHSKPKKADLSEKDSFKIEDQIVDETTYQTLANEKDAQSLKEDVKPLVEASKKTVEVSDRVLFDYDSFSVENDESKNTLEMQVKWLKSNPEIKITIEGHCDERGTREYNIALGEKRANSVKNFFERNGINTDRIQIISFGKEKPASFGGSEESQKKNRRAVIVQM